ncbi:MAG: MFS transporter [bacterium]|jgi:dipeptide/tripeptide permease|nr:MFS transporter [candidate division KSB1 bacterium]MDH7560909.1 MFS transporter [bacterium]
MDQQKKSRLSGFSRTFWVSIVFEFFERGAYYGMMSFLSVYLTGQLHFAKESVGLIKGTIQPLLYFLPILSGAVADRFGYRRTLLVSFSLLGAGYFLTSQVTSYTAVFASLVVMGLGAGVFKPIISGTIARTTDESTSSLGFGIYYWSINLGAFLFPLILVPYLKNSFGPRTVILASALATGSMLIPTLLAYRDPARPKSTTNLLTTLANAFEIVFSPFVLLFYLLRQRGAAGAVGLAIGSLIVLGGIALFVTAGSVFLLFVAVLLVVSLAILAVRWRGRRSRLVPAGIAAVGVLFWLLPGLSLFTRIVVSVIYATVFSLLTIEYQDMARARANARFLLMILIYSGFWILYFQMFDSVLWYVNDYVNAAPLNRVVNAALHAVGLRINWFFDVEHVTVINAGTIIALQLIVSAIVRKTRALPTMVAGILFGTVGMAILAISPSIWVFIVGIIIFSIGEMTAHPKFFSYVGMTAPKDRVATYMGYIFLYGVIGSSVGAILGAHLYVHFVDTLHQPRTLWLLFSGIGVLTILGLVAYDRFLVGKTDVEKR